MDRAYIKISNASNNNCHPSITTRRTESSIGTKRGNPLQMDKKALLKGDDPAIKGHIDTYEYISNTFKNLHD